MVLSLLRREPSRRRPGVDFRSTKVDVPVDFGTSGQPPRRPLPPPECRSSRERRHGMRPSPYHRRVVLDELRGMALDLTWSWEPRIRRFFEGLAPRLWEESAHNPVVLLARLGEAGISSAMQRPEVQAAFEEARNALREHRERRPPPLDAGAPLLMAYFSLEFGLTEALPIYSGGLGVLAGDHLKAANDLGLPLVGVGLLYRQGFGRQRIDDQGNQYETYPENVFEELPLERVMGSAGPLEVECPLGEGSVRVGVWR